ncbi:MAG TPA: murein biosynthesis integral membrane protein MurJ [Acidimicrobiia bacterium]
MTATDASHRLARRSAAVGTGTLVSRLTGVVRVAITAAVLGQTVFADTYNAANITPNILYELLVGGILTAALVPVFVDAYDADDDTATSAVFTVAMTAVLLLTGIGVLLSPVISAAMSGRVPAGQHGEAEAVGTLLVALFLPQMVFYAYTALATAALNARRRFTAAAFAPALNNLVVIVVLLAIRASLPSCGTTRKGKVDECLRYASHHPSVTWALGLGTTAGIAAMAIALWPAMRRSGLRIRFKPEWRHPAVVRMARMSGWTVGYVIANQFAFAFVLWLSRNEKGVFSDYTYAYAFFQLPHGLIAVSIMTALAPALATAARTHDFPVLRRQYELGMRYLLVAIIPAEALLLFFARPVIDAVLQYGSFASSAAGDTAKALVGFSVGLVPFSLYLYTLRAFYSMSDARTPFIVNCIENAANIAFAIILYPSGGVRGLALSFALAYTLAAVIALVLLYRRLGGFPTAPAVGLTARAVAAAAVAVVIAVVVRHGVGGGLAGTVLAIASGGAAYVGALWCLRTGELRGLASAVRGSGTPRV